MLRGATRSGWQLRESPEGVSQGAPACVDSATVSGIDHDEHVTALLGGGLLSERLRHGHESFAGDPAEDEERDTRPPVSLGPASQIELEGDQVRFLVPFAGQWPGEHWLVAFRQAHLVWPSHLVEPRLDEGRGLQLGPLPVALLEEHVSAAKEQVAAANRIYVDEIEPELRRQRDEARRREQEEHQLQANVEAKLRHLLG
jgi:hypothetical protein